MWSLYVPHSGHYMYRTVVTICTAQWSLYVPHSGHYMYRQFNIQQSYVLPHTAVFMCFVWISEQTAIISPHNINWLFFTKQALCCVSDIDLRSVNSSDTHVSLKAAAIKVGISQQGPCWISVHSVWYLWLREWHWDRFVVDRVAMGQVCG